MMTQGPRGRARPPGARNWAVLPPLIAVALPMVALATGLVVLLAVLLVVLLVARQAPPQRPNAAPRRRPSAPPPMIIVVIIRIIRQNQ